MAEEKLERNKAIFNDRNNGMTYKELSKKYGLSESRLNQIILNMKRKSEKNEWKTYASWDPGRPLTVDESYHFYK